MDESGRGRRQRGHDHVPTLTCIVIGAGGLCAGPLGVFAFLVLPVLSVYPFTHSLRTLAILSSATGAVCAFIGFYLSYALDDWNLPVTAAQVIVLGAVWVGSGGVALCINPTVTAQ